MLYEQRECKIHGLCKFKYEKYKKSDDGYRWRCQPCGYERQLKANRKWKQTLVERAGGKCSICGYNKYAGALDFHHTDPTTKTCKVSDIFLPRKKREAEAAKCILLCKNCHAEIEDGLVTQRRLN